MSGNLRCHIVRWNIQKYRGRIDASTGARFTDLFKAQPALVEARVTWIHFNQYVGSIVNGVGMKVGKVKQGCDDFFRTVLWVKGKPGHFANPVARSAQDIDLAPV